MRARRFSASDLTLAQLTLTAKKLGALVQASNEVMADASGNLRQFVEMDLLKTMSAKLDYELLEGTGAGAELTGLRRLTGPTVTTLGSGSGAVVTPDNVLDAITRCKTNNADPKVIVCHPRTAGQLIKAKGGDANYYLVPNLANSPAPSLFGLPIVTSSQISITEDVGGATKSWLAVVDPAQLVVGRRLEINLFLDPYSKSDYDSVLVRATARFAGLGILNAGAVEIIAGLAAG